MRENENFLNLKQIYKLQLTPERKVEAFRRFVIKLKQQKSYGRSLSSRDYFQVDVSLFREEALYMKDLDVEADTHIRLTKEIRCLEEMTDEQILCYYTLVKRFRKNELERASMAYARYYMLEVVNLIYQETPEEAYEVLFSFWEALNRNKKVSGECAEYFCQICQLFMLAHQQLMPDMLLELERQSGRDWTGEAFAQLEQGDYSGAARFVQQNARLLKAEEVRSDAEDVRYVWEAMPSVFRALEEKLADYDFRHVIMNGFYTSVYIGDYPVKNASLERPKRVSLSKYMYYEYQEYSGYWRFWYYVLRRSVQDLLNVIRQYTRACVRRYLRLSGGKCTAARLLNKNYTGGADRPQEVEHLKRMVADPRFEAAVQEGVSSFLRENGIPVPERKRRKNVKEQADMDYEGAAASPAVDLCRLKKARADADLVLGMLSEGEIAYAETEPQEPENVPPDAEGLEAFWMPENERYGIGNVFAGTERRGPDFVSGETQANAEVLQKQGSAADEKDGLADVRWSPEERKYLRLLRTGGGEAAAEWLRALQMPENIMMKQINEKALCLLGDLLLERREGAVCVIEDYEGDADRITEERP